MNKSRRAASVIEATVGLGVFGLVTSLISSVFVLSHRYTRISHQVSRAQREAVACMAGLARELNRAHSESFPTVSAANQTWFLSNRPLETQPPAPQFSAGGEVLWQKWLGVWCEADGKVFRAETSLAGGAVPFGQIDGSAGPVSLAVFQVLPQKKRLASCIQRLQVVRDERVVTVQVDSQASTLGNASTHYHLSSSFLIP